MQFNIGRFATTLWFSGFIVVGAAAPLGATETGPEQVIENILRSALESNPSILAEDAAVAGALRAAESSNRLPDPRLGIQYSPVPIETRGGPQRAAVSIEQPFPFFGKRGLRADEARADASVADARRSATTADLRLEVATHFWEVYRIDRAIEIAGEEKVLVGEILSAAEAKYGTGDGSQANLIQAQLLQTQISNRLLLLEGERAATVEKIAAAAGSPIPVPVLLPLTEALLSIDSSAVIAAVGESNARVIVRAEAVRKTNASLDLARRDYYPDFSLSARWHEIGNSDLPGEFDGRDAWSVGAMVSLPLFRGDLGDRVAARRHALHSAEERHEAERARAFGYTRDVLHRIASTGASIDLYRDGLIPQARAAFESAMAAYSTGRLEFADLVLAERALLEMRLGYHETVARYRQLAVRLEWLVGATEPEPVFTNVAANAAEEE